MSVVHVRKITEVMSKLFSSAYGVHDTRHPQPPPTPTRPLMIHRH